MSNSQLVAAAKVGGFRFMSADLRRYALVRVWDPTGRYLTSDFRRYNLVRVWEA